jgi:hypothetical protein
MKLFMMKQKNVGEVLLEFLPRKRKHGGKMKLGEWEFSNIS